MLDENTAKGFRGIWIPWDIWIDDNLSMMQKITLGGILHLSTGNPPTCHASNEELAGFFGIPQSTFQARLSELRKKSRIETIEFDGRNREIRVCSTKEGEA
jgi:hypothetical protein